MDPLLVHIQCGDVEEPEALGTVGEANLPAVQQEVVKVRLVLDLVPELDPLRLPDQDDPAVPLSLGLHHAADAGGGLDVAVVELDLLHDQVTELIGGQDVELVTGVAGDVLGLLVVHQDPGEH